MNARHNAKLLLKSGLFIVILAITFIALIGIVNAEANPTVREQSDPQRVVIYFFWGDGCPHCSEAEPFLQELAANNPAVELKAYEVWYDDANRDLFLKFSELYGFTPRAVPTILIGDKRWEGYSDQIQEEIQSAVDACLVSGCPDKGGVLVGSATPSPTASPEINPTPGDQVFGGEVIKLPLIGEIDLSHQSLFISTLLISFVDGFNPCSIWVLSMLLAITLHSGSRKRVLIIGLIFVTITAAIYALFITGLFTMFKVVSFVGWIQVVVALVALFFSLVNIKDYFLYKEGVSFTISDDKKPGLFAKMRKVMDAGDSWWGLISGTIVLSAGVSLVEFSCTAGFPVLWTNLLVTQNVPLLSWLFVGLLIVYMLIYQLDELGLFLAAVFTLKSNKMEEKHGRILKLIGGVLMLTLAIVMLVKPSLMSDIGRSVVIFIIAFAVTGLILLFHRVILPKYGVHIGTEFSKKKRRR